MTITLSPNQSSIMTAFGNFLAAVLPIGTTIIQGQDNRVPEPSQTDFVIFTPIRRERIETNIDTPADCSFIASIAGSAMTVTQVLLGKIGIGDTLSYLNVPANLTVIAGPSNGLAGVYTISAPQTLSAQKIACGNQFYLQPTKIVIQCDCHSANVADSADFAETISALFRDDFAGIFFADYAGITPLYADDPKQVPFINAEQQYETRWIVEACLQADQAVKAPQQFADKLKVQTIEVDAAYH